MKTAKKVSLGYGLPKPQNFSELVQLSKVVAAAATTPKDLRGNWESCMTIIMQGAELGFGVMQSIQSFGIIHGKPVLTSDAILALVVSHPDFVDIIEEYDPQKKVATCSVKRKGRKTVTRTFSLFDAQLAGLDSKNDLYKKYPQRLLGARARAFALRDCFPDAIKGVGIMEEVETWDVVEQSPEAETKAEKPEKGVSALKERLQEEVAQNEETEPVTQDAAQEEEEDMALASYWINLMQEAETARELFEIAAESNNYLVDEELEKAKAAYHDFSARLAA